MLDSSDIRRARKKAAPHMQVGFFVGSQAEIFSEIEFPRNGALGNGFAVAFKEEFTLAEEVDAIDDVECLADVVVGDENAHAALAQVLDDLLDVRDSEWVNACKRLIKHNKLWVYR